MRKELSEEEKQKYRKGCLTGLVVAFAVIVLSGGINNVTSLRTNIKKSVNLMTVYSREYPKEFADYGICIHVANSDFITVKTNLSHTGESVAKAHKIKDEILSAIRENNIHGSGIVISAKDGRSLYDSTTRGGD